MIEDTSIIIAIPMDVDTSIIIAIPLDVGRFFNKCAEGYIALPELAIDFMSGFDLTLVEIYMAGRY